jgi:hypothetical protein
MAVNRVMNRNAHSNTFAGRKPRTTKLSGRLKRTRR